MIRLIRVPSSFWWPAKPRRAQLRAPEQIRVISLHPRDRTTNSRGQPERPFGSFRQSPPLARV